MKVYICLLLCIGALASAEERVKRQATYTFPGPRVESSPRQAAPAYHPQQPRPSRAFAEEPEDENLYQPAPRRPRYQSAPEQATASARSQPPPQPTQTYEAPPAQPRQSYSPSSSSTRSRSSSSSNRANKYGGSAPQQSLGAAEEEEEQGPDPLTLLLEDSKFTCGGKGDGYYADDSVNCQVFHYCVSGARHSWMCPEGTVFHQVHLNCVPEGQDICAQSQKFHFVNEYLYKPLDYDGPNNTARYSQRYYPDGYVNGDVFSEPQGRPQAPPQQPPPSYSRPQAPPPQQAPPSYSRPQTPPPQQAPPSYRPRTRVQSYPAPGPVPRQQAPQQPRQLAPPPPPPPSQQPPSYSVPAQPAAGYSPSAASAPSRGSPRPSRPSQSYPSELPHGYRHSPPPRVEPPPHSVPVEDDEDESYQPETRRYAGSPRSTSGYAAPRQYRPVSARSGALPARQQYPTYASNQAAGVQYDEDY